MFDSWHLVMGPFGIRVAIGIKCLKLDLIAKTLSLLKVGPHTFEGNVSYRY